MKRFLYFFVLAVILLPSNGIVFAQEQDIISFGVQYQPQIFSGNGIQVEWERRSLSATPSLILSAACSDGVSIRDMFGLTCTYASDAHSAGINVSKRTKQSGVVENTTSAPLKITFILTAGSEQSQEVITVLPAGYEEIIPSGAFVKTASDSAVYYVNEDKTLSVIPHESVYFSYGYKDFSQVKVATLSGFLKTTPVAFPEGSLFRGTQQSIGEKDASAVFVVEEGKLRPIVSSEVYQSIYSDPQWSRVAWIPDDLLSKFNYPIGENWTSSSAPPVGTILQDAETYYRVEKENGVYIKKKLSNTKEELTNNKIPIAQALQLSVFGTNLSDGSELKNFLVTPTPATISDTQHTPIDSVNNGTLTIIAPKTDDIFGVGLRETVRWQFANLKEPAVNIKLTNSENEEFSLGSVSVLESETKEQEATFVIDVALGTYSLSVCNGAMCDVQENITVTSKSDALSADLNIKDVTGIQENYLQDEEINVYFTLDFNDQIKDYAPFWETNVYAQFNSSGTVINKTFGTYNVDTGRWEIQIHAPATSSGQMDLEIVGFCTGSPTHCEDAGTAAEARNSTRVEIISTDLVFVSPVSNAQWARGANHTVEWTGGRGDTSLIYLESVTYPGSRMLLSEGNAFNGGHGWDILSDAPIGVYEILVELRKEGSFLESHRSDPFSIIGTGAVGIFPVKGDQLKHGRGYSITWPYWFIGDSQTTVTIRLNRDGTEYSSLVSKIGNSGLYEWTVPFSVTTGPSYSINISPENSTKGIIYTSEFDILP